ncbi:ankyrin repeat-containing domain protein [Trichophaea hybrida]|nr:ankyrin repeat-containing domain protein [Trichophaea hybrida]
MSFGPPSGVVGTKKSQPPPYKARTTNNTVLTTGALRLDAQRLLGEPTLLQRAAYNHQLPLAQKILRVCNVNVNFAHYWLPESFGRRPAALTALDCAVIAEDREMIRFLLSCGARNGGNSSLLFAPWIQDVGVLEILIVEGGVDIEDLVGGCTPLSWVTKWGNIAAVRKLLELGANARSMEGGKGSALWSLSRICRLEGEPFRVIAEMLLAAGDDVNARAKDGSSPLHSAAVSGSRSQAEFLLEKGAELDCRNLAGETPLHVAAVSMVEEPHPHFLMQRRLQVVELLLERGADIGATMPTGGRKVLHVAAAGGAEELVELLMKHGADADARDANGNTPKLLAMNHGHRNLLPILGSRSIALGRMGLD